MTNKVKGYLQKINENIDIISIFLWMVAMPIITFLSYSRSLSFDYNNLNIILIVILIYSLIYKLIKSKFKIQIYDIFILLLLLLTSISTSLALDKDMALYGAFRENGFIMLLTYGLIILNIMRIADKRKIWFIIITIICLGIINVIYSCIQVFMSVPGIYKFYKPYMAYGLCSNPNFLGSFMSLLLAISIALFVIKDKYKIVNLILSLVFLLGLYLAQSTGPLVGVVIAVIFLFIIILLYHKECIKKYILIIIILSISFIGIHIGCTKYFDYKGYEIDERYTVVGGCQDIYKFVGKYFFGIKVEVEEDVGNGRFRIWKKSMPILKKYALIGCGTDNFNLVYEQDRFPVIFAEAHNVYLNYAINNGIPAALIYIFALLYLLYDAIKTKDKNTLAISIAYVAFCVQAFFGISAMQSSSCFYLITGLLIALVEMNKNNI